MKASNFSFLKPNYLRLVKLGEQAEQYVHSDPQAAVFKLRAFCELLVEYIYHHLQLDTEDGADFFTRLDGREFRKAVSTEIQGKLHTIRKYGNKAVHNKEVASTDDALWLTEECYLIGRWFIQTMQANYVFVPEFVKPLPKNDVTETLEQDNQQLKQKVDQSATMLDEAQAELDALRQELHSAQEAQQSAENAAEKLRAFQEASREAANSFDLQMDETRRRLNISDFFSDFDLTEGQEEAVRRINSFLDSDELNGFILHGYAGTGKTFITKGIVDYLTAAGRPCVLMAPTGKAAKVIAEKTKYDASTIHRAIYDFRRAMDDEGENVATLHAPVAENFDCEGTVYIVDESSMLSDHDGPNDGIRFGSGQLLTDLIQYLRDRDDNQRRKVIFIGDNAQLPPVNDKFSPALSASYLLEKHRLAMAEWTLDEVVRQKADSGVMDNATMLRKAISSGVFNQLDFSVDKPDIEPLEHDQVIDRYMQLCGGNARKTKEVVLITSSNSQVSIYNQQCRERFFPNQTEVCVNDKVISVANHYRQDITVTNGEFGLIRNILSGPETRTVTFQKKVKEGGTKMVTVNLTFKDVEVIFRNDQGTPFTFQTKIVESLLYNDEPALTPEERQGLYVDFLNRNPDLRPKSKLVERRLALRQDPYFNAFQLKFGYAITCHKAQGSEWKHVLVKCSTYLKTLTQDYFRWLYTAITRTSANLYVIDAPSRKIGGDIKVTGDLSWFEEAQPEPDEPAPSDANAEMDDAFGIDDTKPALRDLLARVRGCLADSGVEITYIRHHAYQELYVLKKAEAFAEVQFIYNGKSRVSSVNVKGSGVLDEVVQHKLQAIKGVTLSNVVAQKEPLNLVFDQPHLEQFHQRVCEVFSGHNIEVSDLAQRDWNQRYTFVRDTESAVVDFAYNGKNQFTSMNPMKNLSSSLPLLSEVVKIWGAA